MAKEKVMESQSTLDVIVPVFNTPISDLERCFNSIKVQSYKKWKCLIVNSSTEREVIHFIDIFCEDNDQFTTIKVKNKGASGNRNKALEFCSSEFVTFIDSDDEIEPTFFEEAIEVTKKDEQVDIVMGLTLEINERQEVQKKQESIVIENYEEKNELLSYLIAGLSNNGTRHLNGILVGRVYPKIIRTGLAKNVKFRNEIIIHEDNIFSFETFEKARKIIVINKTFYKYYKNGYSITNSKTYDEFENQKLINEIQFSKQLIEVVKKSKYKISESALGIRLANNVLNYIYGIYDWKSTNENIKLMLKSGILYSIPKAEDYSQYSLNVKQKSLLLSNGKLRNFIFVTMVMLRTVKLLMRKLTL